MKMRECNICQGLRNILPGICLNHRDCLLTGPGKYMYNMSSSFNAGGVVVVGGGATDLVADGR